MNYTRSFIRAANFVLAPNVEGGLSLDPEDSGNWTGGRKGVGELKGSKYGVSAKAYPNLDIASLSSADAQFIYWRDYWMKMRLDELPPQLAFVVFDAAVNQGVEAAARMLQRALGVEDDGVVGPETIAAARTMPVEESIPVFLGHRGVRYASSPPAMRDRFGLGWFTRLARVGFECGR